VGYARRSRGMEPTAANVSLGMDLPENVLLPCPITTSLKVRVSHALPSRFALVLRPFQRPQDFMERDRTTGVASEQGWVMSRPTTHCIECTRSGSECQH